MNIVDYNEKIKNEFMKEGGVNLLTKYVMSETLPPICDYQNAVKIIQSQYNNQISCELLILGAFLTIEWIDSQNEMLDILNLIYNFLSDKEKSIINYLNALSISSSDDDYGNNIKYREELVKSTNFKVPFVYNWIRLARLLEKEDAHECYKKAMENIKSIASNEDIKTMTINDFVDSKNFINEEILGISLSSVNYNDILNEYNNAMLERDAGVTDTKFEEKRQTQ